MLCDSAARRLPGGFSFFSLRRVAGHEFGHRMKDLAPKEFDIYVSAVRDAVPDFENLVERKQALMQANHLDTDVAAATEEVAADYAGRLMSDGDTMEQFIQQNRHRPSLLKRMAEAFRELWRKLTGKERTQAEEAAYRLEKAYEKAVETQRKAGKKNATQAGGGERLALNPQFSVEFDRWYSDRDEKNKLKTGGYFLVGTTSDALKTIGVRDYSIYWDKSKLAKIMDDHPEMSTDVIKEVPDIMENPIVVMQSKTVMNRITLYGQVMAKGNIPVMVAMELRPQNKRGEIMDFAKVASAYGRDTVQADLNSSDVLYIDPNKKRTDAWLEALGLQLPAGLTKYGSIASVTYMNRDVNGNFTFNEGKNKTPMQIAIEEAQAKSNTKFSLRQPIEGQNPYDGIDIEYLSPESITPFNPVTDQEKYDYLVKNFSKNGYDGRPIVVHETPYGYQALTGSHRTLAARETGIEIPAVVIRDGDVIDRLYEASDDWQRALIADELFEEGLIDEQTRYLLARENELNNENFNVPINKQTRFSLRTDAELEAAVREIQQRREAGFLFRKSCTEVLFFFSFRENRVILKKITTHQQRMYTKMFVDVAKIRIKAGKGGDGHIGFHREKYVASGGPDGGDGGRGGNIVFVTDPHMATLLDFRYKRKYTAEDGQPGGTKRCFGRDGADSVIKVPLGTLIRDGDTGALLHDMSDDKPFIAARGGKGGWGNAHFATPTRQAPRFAKPGQEGDERFLMLELKLIADVGLIGFPNVGKSTLLSMISAARPKIANYHFTTLQPNLGVVFISEGSSFVCADIPGIIEGASEGAGLGHDFLRHIERCRLLVHLVDAAGSEGRDPVDDLDTINRELQQYSPTLAQRPQIIVANKCDLLPEDRDNLSRLEARARELGYAFFSISAAASQGVRELTFAVWNQLQTLPPVEVFEAEVSLDAPAQEQAERDIQIRRGDDAVFYISGAWVEKIVGSVNFDEYESRMYFERTLRKAGVFDLLEQRGIQEGDTVDVLGLRFEYVY